MVFPVVMYRCESWTVKKAERQRIDAFELWYWRRLLRVPWTARSSNQSILKISPGISLEGMMLKLKLQYFGHLIRRVDSLEKTLMLGGTGGRRRRGQQRMRWLTHVHHWLDGRESEWTPGVGDGQGGLACYDSWGRKESDTTERLSWTELNTEVLALHGTMLTRLSAYRNNVLSSVQFHGSNLCITEPCKTMTRFWCAHISVNVVWCKVRTACILTGLRD